MLTSADKAAWSLSCCTTLPEPEPPLHHPRARHSTHLAAALAHTHSLRFFPTEASPLGQEWATTPSNAQATQATRNMKNQGNMIPPKKFNPFPVTDAKEMGMYELPDK